MVFISIIIVIIIIIFIVIAVVVVVVVIIIIISVTMKTCETNPRSSAKAGGLFSNMADFRGCHHLEFSAQLLIGPIFKVPSLIW